MEFLIRLNFEHSHIPGPRRGTALTAMRPDARSKQAGHKTRLWQRLVVHCDQVQLPEPPRMFTVGAEIALPCAHLSLNSDSGEV